MRALTELTDAEDPAWPVLMEEVASASVPVRVLAADEERGRAALLQMQVTSRSFLGAVALCSGGLLVDDGWLRVYGSPRADDPVGMPGLAQVNRFPVGFDAAWAPEGGLVVAHDVLGGVFVLNGGDCAAVGRPGEPGEMVYLAPDSLRWEPLEAGYAAWLPWVLGGGIGGFYDGLRWRGCRDEVGDLSGNQGLSIVPFLWSREAREDLAGTSRRPVAMAELLGLNAEFCSRFDGVGPGFLGVV